MGDISLLNIVIALALGVAIWRGSVAIVRMLATPPPEVDPDDTQPVDQPYRCTVCGTEVTMTVQNVKEADPPKHCREEMVPVWRPG